MTARRTVRRAPAWARRAATAALASAAAWWALAAWTTLPPLAAAWVCGLVAGLLYRNHPTRTTRTRTTRSGGAR
ncbi:hypothetical protein [Spongiactinospora sp. 9N601]|uniref:hypothetical protein n=1 Tax=Spongiactinospora sp. 9N601 TaxID=3375149 RepID=UPI003796863E